VFVHGSLFNQKKNEHMSPPRSMSKRPALAAAVAVVVAMALLEGVSAMCPNLCNANGLCNANNLCTCFPGYTGPECNQRE
jgi:hypothetical protein